MLESLQFCQSDTRRWNGNRLIPKGKHVKKITVGDSRLVWIVLNEDLWELASIPINFSIAILPYWATRTANAKSESHREPGNE